jgi:hypothetical protein
MLILAPIISHEAEGGFLWWDVALMFAIPIVLGVLVVLWITRRSNRSDDEPHN